MKIDISDIGEFTVYVRDNVLEIYDHNDNSIHSIDRSGFEEWHEYNADQKSTHYKNSNGVEEWTEYDSNGHEVHYKDSDGFVEWYNSDGDEISKKEFSMLYKKVKGIYKLRK